ncbi:EAL domain-containing protein [Sinorhizobium meliloti]|uniref:putative bifunctional diguanylate cyclase/phosphodiesterase n=1 Tax=Rhizobium meliloti TaxID=382 RepID=UPI000FDC3125|nr:EAL domain-containing protein [Sinorhizobium meliloti]RVG04109.1 EAL domain-containing protein [Sinorhizobium meliloti]RVH42410.1 EAL domain-containing protein [Sinorhizobium meliloti]RVK16164.1 EAL domain-containing protein [Sinorhizobium meliloti]
MRFVAGKVAVFRWMLPLAIAMALMGGIYLAVRWSAQQSDAVAVKRQQQLVELVISKMQGSIAHDQESVTVWDDAVRKVSQEWDRRWVDSNLGSWMNSYFRHDGAFVIRPDRKPLYAFLAGQTDEQEAFSEIEPEAMPLIAKLQERLAAGDEGGTSEQVLSIGESDLVRIGGRPAIVSVKPIVSDTGDIVQEPGKEFLHLAVRFLDGDLLTHLGEDYGFEDLRFSVLPELGRQRSYVPIVSSSGETIGYFSWLPFRPGADVMKATAPVLLVAGALLFTLTSALSIVLRRRSRRLQESQAELNHLASHDPLTGLANRASFNRLLARVVARSTADQTNALLYLDLDRFKQVNDTLGHPVGDRLMVEVAKRLKETAAGAAISRIGGDEFTIVVERTRQDQVEKLCDSLIAAIHRPFEIDGQPILIGLSIGVAVATGNGADPVEITRKADIALYHAKSAGRNRYAVFGPHMDELIRTKRDLEHDLRAALDAGNQLEVFYQPVYSAQSHEISSLEALIRWRHPSKGSIAPDAFVPLAETAGLIDRLGAFVLKEACSTAREFPGLDIAVNVSAVELGQRHYAAQVLSLLRQFGIEPARLELEITETALLDEAGVCEKNITALREFGVKFALDDFGTGFSSFGRLQRLEVDRIKIDRSFVHAFDRSGGGVAVVRSIVGVAHAKGLRITAEGVETEEQSEILRELGCDELQGFHLSRPMSKNSLRQLLGTDKAQGTSF